MANWRVPCLALPSPMDTSATSCVGATQPTTLGISTRETLGLVQMASHSHSAPRFSDSPKSCMWVSLKDLGSLPMDLGSLAHTTVYVKFGKERMMIRTGRERLGPSRNSNESK